MDFVFAADVDTAKTDKTSFPDFPGENPPQADMLKWLDAWHDDLVTSGNADTRTGPIGPTHDRS